MKQSKSDFRFLIGTIFGFIAEVFARIAIYVSGNQLDLDFNYIGDALTEECTYDD